MKILGDYRAMITNVEHPSIFDLRASRRKADLLTYFKNLPDKDRIQWVTMNLYDVYRQVVRTTLPQARIVVDRFLPAYGQRGPGKAAQAPVQSRAFRVVAPGDLGDKPATATHVGAKFSGPAHV
ncbi:transposase TnpA [mine drainage metagenome]|uniref:Transposase TnpA n=1 Tax=mine drainage metagenome TaxID=410659 RepID=T1A242_9ZZZZ